MEEKLQLQSLAKFLGVQDPEKPNEPFGLPAETVELPAPTADMDDSAFCRGVIASTQYRESLLRRLITDSLPSAVETMLWERAHGRVAQRVEHTGKEGKPIEQRVVFYVPHNGRDEDFADVEHDQPMHPPPERIQ
jgi:hypothetical protein